MSNSTTDIVVPLHMALVIAVACVFIFIGMLSYSIHVTTENNMLHRDEGLYISSMEETWDALDALIARIEPHESGTGLHIRTPQTVFRTHSKGD